MVGGQGGHSPSNFRNRRIFGSCSVSSENFWTLAVGKDKGFEFYRKIFELARPTLQATTIIKRIHNDYSRAIYPQPAID